MQSYRCLPSVFGEEQTLSTDCALRHRDADGWWSSYRLLAVGKGKKGATGRDMLHTADNS